MQQSGKWLVGRDILRVRVPLRDKEETGNGRGPRDTKIDERAVDLVEVVISAGKPETSNLMCQVHTYCFVFSSKSHLSSGMRDKTGEVPPLLWTAVLC